MNKDQIDEHAAEVSRHRSRGSGVHEAADRVIERLREQLEVSNHRLLRGVPVQRPIRPHRVRHSRAGRTFCARGVDRDVDVTHRRHRLVAAGTRERHAVVKPIAPHPHPHQPHECEERDQRNKVAEKTPHVRQEIETRRTRRTRSGPRSTTPAESEMNQL